MLLRAIASYFAIAATIGLVGSICLPFLRPDIHLPWYVYAAEVVIIALGLCGGSE